MKITIITLYKGSFPFIDELLLELDNKGIDTCVFDMVEMYTVKLIGGEKKIDSHTDSQIIKRLSRLRYIGTISRVFFYKRYFKKNNISTDHINIHYTLPFYSVFMRYFSKISKSVSVVVWGSDFLRVNERKRKQMAPIFNHSNVVLIPNTQLASTVGDYYGCQNKIRHVGFGIGKLDEINRLVQENSKESFKQHLNIPSDKLIVTIGYNGIPAQQHLPVLESFMHVEQKVKDKLFIVLPFGYGGNLDYKERVIAKVETLGIKYLMLDRFISNSDVAKIRICTDLVINAQISDGSSASLQEHLYAKNILLVGEWLQYRHFSDAGIKFWTFDMENIGQQVNQIIHNFEKHRNEIQNNSDIIYKMSSWKTRINQWIELFENKL